MHLPFFYFFVKQLVDTAKALPNLYKENE